MNAKTIRVEVSAIDVQGSVVIDDLSITADTILRDGLRLVGGSTYGFLELRLLIPKDRLDDVTRAVRQGKVELLIDSIPARVAA
jgi:hypothetical protein